MLPGRLVFLVFAVPGILATASYEPPEGPPRDVTPTAAACEYGPWGTPQPILGIAAGVRPEYASLVSGRAGRFFVATDVSASIRQNRPDTLVTGPLWVGVDLEAGTSIPPPPAGRLVANAKAVLDGEGSLHVVWAENDTLPLPADWRWATTNATSLWYGQYRPEQGWTAQFELFRPRGRGHVLTSSDESYGAIALDRFDRIHVSFRASDSMNRRGLVGHILLAERGEPRLTFLGEDSLGLGLGLPVLPLGDTVHLVHTSRPLDLRDPLGRFQSFNVQMFARRSTDAGMTWEPPVEVGARLPGRIHPVWGFRDGIGAAHLVWSDAREEDATRELIRHAWLPPGRTEWQESAFLEPPHGFRYLHATGDACGAVHVVYHEWIPEEERTDRRLSRLLYTQWSATDGWSTPVEPVTGAYLVAPTLAADSTALLLYGLELIWTGIVVDGRERPVFEPRLVSRPISFRR